MHKWDCTSLTVHNNVCASDSTQKEPQKFLWLFCDGQSFLSIIFGLF
ncbi:hypothetical protein HMPREF9080_00407 [Cardiobacterium valvarum F0432]|uniref:Uncharacterized protein n=1 Tax=Cardiobacterium valvarum F0432 TaxID=797473 RepID=G9ZCD0_9GAMM|nr:hypothetical protein HMPREF9080_00407 [Cardiobacterium valvarum F0432]